MEAVALTALVAASLLFAFTNGFHDASNAVATSVTTRALTPLAALGMAATANVVGAFFGDKVARTIGIDIVSLPAGPDYFVVVLVALLAAAMWNLLTWWRGMPSSSTHALLGGLVGGVLALGGTVNLDVVTWRILLPMVLSPLAGFVLGWLGYVLLIRVFHDVDRRRSRSRFRYAQTASAAAVAFGHGMQDAAKAAGALTLGLTALGAQRGDGIPLWALVASALAIAAGTLAGGWRIVRTLGQGIITLDQPRGLVAESTAAGVLFVAGGAAGAPVSTTYTIAAAILGTGAANGWRSIRWPVVRTMIATWLVTVPATAVMAALFAALALLGPL